MSFENINLEAILANLQSNELTLAKKYIKLLSREKINLLFESDEDNKTLLMHSIELGHKEIAMSLLALTIKHSQQSLLNSTGNGSTLFTILAKSSMVEVVDIVIEVLKKKNNYQTILTHLFGPNLSGNTPLHVATLASSPLMMIKLLSLLNKNSIHLNTANSNGDTVAHLVAKSYYKSLLLAALIDHGAELKLSNHAGTTAFDLIYDLDDTVILNIFRHIKEVAAKNYFIRLFDAKLKSDNDVDKEKAKRIYSKLTRLHSLKSYVLAHLEYDDNVSVRNSYVATKRISDKSNQVEVKDIYLPHGLPETFYSSLPTFFKKVKAGIIDEYRSEQDFYQKENITLESLLHPFNQFDCKLKQNKSLENLLASDASDIRNLIAETIRYLNDLVTRPSSFTLVKPAKMMTGLLGISTIALSTFYSVQAHKWNEVLKEDHGNLDQTFADIDHKFKNIIAAGLIALVGFISVGVVSVRGIPALRNYSFHLSVSPTDTSIQTILRLLNDKILSKLDVLERREQDSQTAWLPITQANLTELRALRTALGSKHTVTQTKEILGDLIRQLTALHTAVTTTSKPLSLLAENLEQDSIDIVIETSMDTFQHPEQDANVEPDEDIQIVEDEEDVPLLRRPR